MSNLAKYLCLFVSLIANIVYAGSHQSTESKFDPEQVAQFAKQVERYAATQGARAFIMSRLGQPAKNLPDGIQFTHTAIAIYSNIQLTDGQIEKGYAIHNLYQNNANPKRSDLVIDYPMDFFWSVHELKAGIIIPSQQLQQRLVNAINNGYATQVHNSKYSLIANPFNNKYQNCTEHTLNLINAAIYQTTDMQQLKANTKAYFQPQKVKTNRFKLALGNLFMDGVRTSDHKGKIMTTTFSSIARYLEHNKLMQQAVIITPQLTENLHKNT